MPGDIIFVGKRPTNTYVLAVLECLKAGHCIIKARGKAMNHAIDIAEIVKNRFVLALVSQVNISTEIIKGNDDKEAKVSAIEICLYVSKKPGVA